MIPGLGREDAPNSSTGPGGPGGIAESLAWAPEGMDPSGSDDRREHPTADQPLHGPRKGPWGPAVLTLVVLGLVIAVFAVITLLRYTT